MSADERLHALLAEARALVATRPPVRDFVGDALADLTYARPEPRHLPAVDRMLGEEMPTCAATQPLVDAMRAASQDLHWSQSYTEAQVGQRFLDHYCWFNLVSPEGPFHHATCRISVGYWGQGLTYPDHSHAPEEIYCVLAGAATFLTEGRAPVAATAGDLIHHPPDIRHGIEMAASPLLAIAFWRGANPLAPSALDGAA